MTAVGRQGLQWRKSSWSANEANCVEVAFAGDDVHTRDSKNPAGQHLMFGQPAWSAFVRGLRDNRFVSPSCR